MTLRVPRAELPAELRDSMIRQLGEVPEPVEVTYNNPKVAMSSQEFSAGVATWDAADASLKTFAHMAVAVQVGCSWCLNVNYFLAQNQNLDLAKASQVPRWRESDVFTPLERDVLAYAEAMTCTPPAVTDELSAALLERPGPAALNWWRHCSRADRAAYEATTVWLNGAPAARIESGGRLAAVSLLVENGQITQIYTIASPRKLTRLDDLAELAR